MSNSSIARTRSRAESTADGIPSGQTGSHRRTPGSNKERHVNAAIDDSSGAVRKQVPVVRSVGSSATGPARRADDIECDGEDLHFRKAVAIGEKLERELEMFLPLLEGVPPHFRSRGYHHRKTEFLNVKEILAGTVKTLKATPHGDVRVIASQYLLFKDMIYDNLRSLLLWLDEELEKYNETRQKGTSTLSYYDNWIESLLYRDWRTSLQKLRRSASLQSLSPRNSASAGRSINRDYGVLSCWRTCQV